MILVNCLWRDLPTRDFIRALIGEYAREEAYEQRELALQISHLQEQVARQQEARRLAVRPALKKQRSAG
ncbi:hypothetical protein PCI56_16395 [Plesiomonas shigelloides subsp. oncorhynchi]|nr:hypothetical protein [Plesiomonas shigelloides]